MELDEMVPIMMASDFLSMERSIEFCTNCISVNFPKLLVSIMAPISSVKCIACGVSRSQSVWRENYSWRFWADSNINANKIDISSHRNVFLVLFNQDKDIATKYLAHNIDDVRKYGDGFALLVLELTHRACRRDTRKMYRFIRVLFETFPSNSPAVSYEAVWILVSLSSAPTDVRTAAKIYTSILNTLNDKNVKMIVLERLEDRKKTHLKIVRKLLMNLLRALSSPNPDICKTIVRCHHGYYFNKECRGSS